jgi:hypothetical protein
MRTGIAVSVTPEDMRRLETVVRDRNSPQKHVARAQVLIATADGCGTTSACVPIATQYNAQPTAPVGRRRVANIGDRGTTWLVAEKEYPATCPEPFKLCPKLPVIREVHPERLR